MAKSQTSASDASESDETGQISVYIICMNEEGNIRRALESVAEFDDIVVVDSGSTDGTLDIVREFTDRIYTRAWTDEYEQRTHAMGLCKHDYVLSLDADEEATDALKADIRDAAKARTYNLLHVKIVEHFMGQAPNPDAVHNTKPVFFNRHHFKYKRARVHIPVEFDGKDRTAKGHITHFGEKSVELAMSKANRYSSFRALDKFEAGKKFRGIKLVLVYPLVFLKTYIFKRAFLNGYRGFILASVSANYAFMKEAKLYEHHYRAKHDRKSRPNK